MSRTQSQSNRGKAANRERGAAQARHAHAQARGRSRSTQTGQRSHHSRGAQKNHAKAPRKQSGSLRHAAPRKQVVAPQAGTPQSKRPLLSRRAFIGGAVGVGAVAAVGAGAAFMSSRGNDSTDDLNILSVPQSALVTQNDFEAIDDYSTLIKTRSAYDIPYGTLVWANDQDVAACLVPTESGSPLAKVGILYLSTGMLQNVREEAVGKSDGFEILDVRANSSGAVWTESNIMEGSWRVYSARLSNGALGTPALLDEGTKVYETPTLGVVGERAFLQKIPNDATDRENTSQLIGATFGSSDANCYYESLRRSASPIYSDGESVVIAPRLDSSSILYQLTRIDAASGNVTDTLVLPQSMRPLEAAYGKTGFMFSFPDIYTYGGGISNLGTYAPLSLPTNGNYSDAGWFGFARTPTAPPAWFDDLLIIKSTYAVCGVNLNEGTYFAIDVENGADSYGEYLASSGSGPTFVTYTNIDHTPVDEERIYACRVKVWEHA